MCSDWKIEVATVVMLIGALVDLSFAQTENSVPLKIGLLMEVSSDSTEVLKDRRRVLELGMRT